MQNGTSEEKDGSGPKRRRRKDARPAEIIAAARAEFVAKGYSLAKVDEIARRARVSKGTVYLYFPTKEQLFEAVIRADVLPVIERLRDAVLADGEGSAIDQLRFISDTMYREIAGTDRRFLTHLIIAEGPRFPWLTEFYHREILSKGQALLEAVLRRGESRGEIHAGNLVSHPEILMAPTIVAALFTILFARHQPFDIESYQRAHTELVLRALATGKERPDG
jgi:AcrR family transcriptional regulator